MKLVFLGKLADLAGVADADISDSLPLGWEALIVAVAKGFGPRLAEEIGSSRVTVAVNGKVIAEKREITVHRQDEVAFLPPVSGG